MVVHFQCPLDKIIRHTLQPHRQDIDRHRHWCDVIGSVFNVLTHACTFRVSVWIERNLIYVTQSHFSIKACNKVYKNGLNCRRRYIHILLLKSTGQGAKNEEFQIRIHTTNQQYLEYVFTIIIIHKCILKKCV